MDRVTLSLKRGKLVIGRTSSGPNLEVRPGGMVIPSSLWKEIEDRYSEGLRKFIESGDLEITFHIEVPDPPSPGPISEIFLSVDPDLLEDIEPADPTPEEPSEIQEPSTSSPSPLGVEGLLDLSVTTLREAVKDVSSAELLRGALQYESRKTAQSILLARIRRIESENGG